MWHWLPVIFLCLFASLLICSLFLFLNIHVTSVMWNLQLIQTIHPHTLQSHHLDSWKSFKVSFTSFLFFLHHACSVSCNLIVNVQNFIKKQFIVFQFYDRNLKYRFRSASPMSYSIMPFFLTFIVLFCSKICISSKKENNSLSFSYTNSQVFQW